MIQKECGPVGILHHYADELVWVRRIVNRLALPPAVVSVVTGAGVGMGVEGIPRILPVVCGVVGSVAFLAARELALRATDDRLSGRMREELTAWRARQKPPQRPDDSIPIEPRPPPSPPPSPPQPTELLGVGSPIIVPPGGLTGSAGAEVPLPEEAPVLVTVTVTPRRR